MRAIRYQAKSEQNVRQDLIPRGATWRLLSCTPECDLDIHKYQVDSYLTDSSLPLDKYWATVIQQKKYPILVKVVTAALSIFHGPHVESSFNVMGDIMTAKSSKINVETYSGVQTVKYWLRSHGKRPVGVFGRKDIIHDPIDKRFSYNMRKAASLYKAELEKRGMKGEQRGSIFT